MTIGATKKDKIDALAATAVIGVEDIGGQSIISDAWRRLRVTPIFWIGGVIILLFVLLAIFSPLIALNDPAAQLLIKQTSRARNTIAPAQPGFPLGGDTLGRDFYSRLILGARQTLLVGVFATLIGFVGGLILGITAGAFGGKTDTVVMRIVDVMLSIPSLLLAVSIAGAVPPTRI